MALSAVKFLILACAFPSLSLAWCSGGVGIGPRAIARAIDANPRPLRARSRGVRLWSGPEGSTSEDEGEGRGGGKMTLQKAAKLVPTFWEMAEPYFRESQPGRRLFYGMIALCLLNSAVSVQFSYIGKDFYNGG